MLTVRQVVHDGESSGRGGPGGDGGRGVFVAASLHHGLLLLLLLLLLRWDLGLLPVLSERLGGVLQIYSITFL